MKVITKDFQRLKGTNTFEFPVGITVIQGRSGSGKSTLFYAIEDCLSNPSGVADVINWDAKSAEVIIENNNEKIKWIKTPSSCEYVDKDNKPYIKASKIDSRDLCDLGFYFNKKGEIVNIHNEWDTIFPFGSSDTEMFKLFEDIFNISSSFQIIDCVKKDEQECKTNINNINKELDNLRIQDAQIQNVLERINPDVDSYINTIQEKEISVKTLLNDYDVLSTIINNKNIIVPDEFDMDLLVEKSSYYNQFIKDYNNYSTNKNFACIDIPEIKTFDIKENPYAEDYTLYQKILLQIEDYDKCILQIDSEEQLVREKLKEIKVCPTCGHEMEN